MIRLTDFITSRSWLEKTVCLFCTAWLVWTSILNLMMCFSILGCQSISQFLQLFDNFWVQNAWLGKVVFQFMEYYYISNPLILLLRCFSLLDILILFGSIIYILQWGNAAQKARQHNLSVIFIMKVIFLAVIVFFLFMALGSKTTEVGFSNLKSGALYYLIGNVAVLCLCSYQLWLLKKT